jgi:PAS domain-containing protein
MSGQGDVLGTFAMYYPVAREPNRDDLKGVEMATRTVAIAIERTRLRQSVRDSERRFRKMFDALPPAVYITGAAGRLTYYNPPQSNFPGVCRSWKMTSDASAGSSIIHTARACL